MNFTYLFRAVAPLNQPYWVHMAYFDVETDEIRHLVKHIPTHSLIKYDEWPLNQVIQEPHVRYVPEELPFDKYRVRVAITTQEELDMDNLGSYRWFDLGDFENKPSLIHPLNIPKAS